MINQFKKFFSSRKKKRYDFINPDEIFLDSQNLPKFDIHQFEGRIEKPISKKVFGVFIFFIIFIGVVFSYKIWNLQVVRGDYYKQKSENNRLHRVSVFANRGLITDRNNIPLAWNSINTESSDFSLRSYATSTGLSNLLGYIKYPTKDSSGFYYQEEFVPKDGIEKIYNSELAGKNGIKITETDVKGNVTSESVVNPAQDGENVILSIDSKLQKKLYDSMLDIAGRAGFKGGAGIIMDIYTGEIIANSNFPEYSSQILTDGKDGEAISNWLNSKYKPFLNRSINGLYTPGSVVKPFIAMGVLDQKIIDPLKQILSTGSISIANPYFPDKPSIFVDWKAHGWVDLRHAIAVSSNVYFYEVTGGYQDQKGIGISNIEKYVKLFGLGSKTGINFISEEEGVIPNPEWKKKNFDGEDWRLGDTYNTAIGQYGFQVTPIQIVKAVSAVANEGTLVTPTFIKGEITQKIPMSVDFPKSYYKIIKEGMRLCVTEGTATSINVSSVEVAAKTGTAQVGISKDLVNSWVMGFFPYKNPRYAFVVVMEQASKTNQFGATLVVREVLDWMELYGKEYIE